MRDVASRAARVASEDFVASVARGTRVACVLGVADVMSGSRWTDESMEVLCGKLAWLLRL